MPGETGIPSGNFDPTQLGQPESILVSPTGSIQPRGGFWSRAWAGTKAVGSGMVSLAGLAALGAWLYSKFFGGSSEKPNVSPNTTNINLGEWLYPGLMGAGLGAGGGWLYDALFGDEDADEKRKKQHLRKSLMVGALLGTLAGVGPKLLGSSSSSTKAGPQSKGSSSSQK